MGGTYIRSPPKISKFYAMQPVSISHCAIAGFNIQLKLWVWKQEDCPGLF